MMRTLALAVPPMLILGTLWQAQWLVELAFRQVLLLRRPVPSQSHSASFCVWSQTDTLVVKYTSRCPDGLWSCCVTIVAFKLSALPFQGSPHTFFYSLITKLSSSGTRCTDLAFWTPFSVRMICSSVIGPLPTQIPWPHLWSRLPVGTDVYLYITLSPNGNTWLVYAFPKTRTNAVPDVFHLKSRPAPCCVSNQPRYQDAVAW